MLDRIKIVLVETSHPGNIGAVARAMKTMGIKKLCLVKPKNYPSAEATERASSAGDVLYNSQVVTTLDEAISDCSWVIGASARSRYLDWPMTTPHELAKTIADDYLAGNVSEGKVALVFGREDSGLTNEELQHCHKQVYIPANPEYSSLNLAMAVQVIGYELRMKFLENEQTPPITTKENKAVPASMAYVEGFYSHIEQTMIKTEFLDAEQPKHLMKRIRRIFGRTTLDEAEINILRGFLKSVNVKIDENKG